MHISNTPPNNLSLSAPSSIRGFVTAIALSVSSCISTHHTDNNDIHPFETESTEECDIDNPVFIALLGISAEIQAGIDSNPENRSLQFVWEKIGEGLGTLDLKHPISVSLCSPVQTERGYAYILIDVAGQQTQIFAKDKKNAETMILAMQESYIEHTAERMNLLLGDRPATRENLQDILKDEETVLEKHRMTAIIKKDSSDIWSVCFEADL